MKKTKKAVSKIQRKKRKKAIVKKEIIKKPIEKIAEETEVGIEEIVSQGEEIEAIKEAPVEEVRAEAPEAEAAFEEAKPEEVKAEAEEEAPAETRVEELEKELTVAEAKEIVGDDEKAKWAQEHESLTTENASLQGEIERLKEKKETIVKDKTFLEAQLKIAELEKELASKNAGYDTLREEKDLLEAQIFELEGKPEPAPEIAELPSQETQETEQAQATGE